jgi:uncharacterized membrane protein
MDLPEWGTDRTAPTYRTETENYGSEKSGITGKVLTVAGGLALAVAGGALAWRGFKSRKSSTGQDNGLEIRTSVTVNRSPEEVYSFWRKLENLPRFMEHLKEVREMDAKHSHWVAKVPGNVADIEWDATVVDEQPGRFINWRSLPDADIENTGEVRFEPALGGQSTTVHAIITYSPPAGAVGSSVVSLLNPSFKKMVKADLRRFKELMETGGSSTIESQPVARKKTSRSS